ncbi:MYG1 exonuclease-like, partial [Chiloscyllium plagiosum]|uniref:MYG1 exonuclease-like n=1 Tax=Chiloscyllium plagiosum TaxID=36176 RepID=UPI001CB80774
VQSQCLYSRVTCLFLGSQDAEIIRTRDPQLLETCDVVVDVGGVYDPERHRYDHHQRSFAETLASVKQGSRFVTKLSSAGLVYAHFGRRVLAQLLQTDWTDPRLDVLYDKLYENFVEEVDAIDNGISQCDGETRYNVTTNLSSRVSYLNPVWNTEDPDTEVGVGGRGGEGGAGRLCVCVRVPARDGVWE